MTETIMLVIYGLIALLAVITPVAIVVRHYYRKGQDKKYMPKDWVDRLIKDQWGRDAYIEYKATHPDDLESLPVSRISQ